MVDININLLDLANDLGMYAAVEYLIRLSEKYQYRCTIEQRRFIDDEKIYHYKIDGEYYKVEGDSEALKIANLMISYGYLKTLPKSYMKFTFFNVENNNDIIKQVKKYNKERLNKIKELRNKTKDIDPYGEEDWIEEKLITKFKVFEKGKFRIQFKGN